MKNVFIVDDNNANLFAAQRELSAQYNVHTLSSASAMFKLLEDIIPDIILLDILLPEIDGFDAITLLKKNEKHKNIPVILMSGKIDADIEIRGFQAGAADFIPKPYSGPALLNRLRLHLEDGNIMQERTKLLLRQTEKLNKLKNNLVTVLANIAGVHDKQAGGHIGRAVKYIKILLLAMQERGIYSDEIRKWDLETVVLTARLYDIGKITIAESILNKEGPLTPTEYEIIKTHAQEGEKIIDGIISESGEDVFFQNAKLFAACHHERWDGKGYPRGLKEYEIPLQGRVMALVDVYGALVSDRPYKNAFTHEKAAEIIRESKGSFFDPKIVDVFLDVNSLFAEAVL